MAQISVVVDDEKCKEFKKVLSEIGISTSDAIRMYIDAVIRYHDIPRAVDPFYSKENMDFLLASKKQLEEGNCEYHDLLKD